MFSRVWISTWVPAHVRIDLSDIGKSGDMSLDREPRMDVTNIDILQAKSGWAAAFESPATNDHVLDLYEDYVRLLMTQAQQITDSFSRPRLRLVE